MLVGAGTCVWPAYRAGLVGCRPVYMLLLLLDEPPGAARLRRPLLLTCTWPTPHATWHTMHMTPTCMAPACSARPAQPGGV